MNYPQNNPIPQNHSVSYYQQKFLEHASFSEHYARQKMANAADAAQYYQFAELEYFHKSRALHYKGLFSAESTLRSDRVQI
ncbi:MAG: hypothetical protein K0S76_2911, partial [Herbinix sp.]|nr:hypothetical protein [Herbinix sp.]